MSCPICGASATRVVARPPGEWTFMECRSCGVYFVDPMPAGDAVPEAGETYDSAYYTGTARADEERWEAMLLAASGRRVEEAERLLGRRGRFLEVGAGTGLTLAAARDRGWQVEGVEVSPAGAAYAQQRFGLDIRVGTLDAAGFGDGSFDVVWMQHVLEHVPDPVALLRSIQALLVPDGLLMVAVPHSRGLIYRAYNMVHRLRGRLGKDKFSCSLSPPGHLYAFDKGSLATALQRAGLRVERMFLSGKGDPVYFPVYTWEGAGRSGLAVAAMETIGRKTGQGSLIECFARPAG